MNEHSPGSAFSRRRFLRIAGTALGAAAFGPVLASIPADLAPAASGAQAFEIVAADGVAVLVGQGRDPHRLDLRVRHRGRVIERFPDTSPAALHRLQSEHFRVRYIDPPTGV